MIKKYKWTLLITSLVILIPMVVGVVLWNDLPDTLATHWGADNEANGFSSKPFTVFGMPLILLGLQWLCTFAEKFDTKRKNQSPFLQKFVLWIIPAVSILMCCLVYGTAMGYTIDISFWCLIAMGILFIITGNYLPKCKQSYTMGIKLPWTLQDEEVWNKTHRLGGFLWVISGLVMLVAAFVKWYWLLLVPLVIAVILPTVYAYVLYQKKHKS